MEQAALPPADHHPLPAPSNNSENAWDDTIQMLREHWAPSGLPGVLHCFTGEWHHAQAALDNRASIFPSPANVSFPRRKIFVTPPSASHSTTC